ncbi:MAG: pyridoxamine 5'-phosphate oxidase family protein [Armatimonadota bacterium]|nr:pyridoxamine 5'-phosphate oxidase family protein [Armatimonadota bacterium]MDR7450695.1 pyridoxamine 5'-phosphate oxidase family protein [Armatimonadota bacterium]MDR7466051.1 pyridoxamine 5'-phosphate oxidase family protein [Armatimonadota bacterium]MDR7493912.1 pyridoxamine 5'-phosphate oxidase family protein [Armatimonadota bacterium]MDR7504017.1 pyridoxamine 5'-phosphate oxidase family protein [Armatimonadota bacterium]
MAEARLDVQTILAAARGYLARRHVCTFATSQDDVPWAASGFYVARELDIFTCQRKDARTLAQMLANPRVGFAVDDRTTGAWLQALGTARPATTEEEAWAREALRRAAPEFTAHFSNPDYPVLAVLVGEFTFIDRAAGIVPRQHLILGPGGWRFA